MKFLRRASEQMTVLMQHQAVDSRAALLSVLTDPIKASPQRIILSALQDFSVGSPVTHGSGVSVKWRARGVNAGLLSCAAAVSFFPLHTSAAKARQLVTEARIESQRFLPSSPQRRESVVGSVWQLLGCSSVLRWSQLNKQLIHTTETCAPTKFKLSKNKVLCRCLATALMQSRGVNLSKDFLSETQSWCKFELWSGWNVQPPFDIQVIELLQESSGSSVAVQVFVL